MVSLDIQREFNRLNIDAKQTVIVGSAALQLYRDIRKPNDVDVVLKAKEWAKVSRSHGGIIKSKSVPCHREHIKIMGTNGTVLDLYAPIADSSLNEFLSDPFKDAIQHQGLWINSLNQVIAMKKLKDRPKDRSDLAALGF